MTKKDKDERVLVHVRVRPLTSPEVGQNIIVSHDGPRKLNISRDGKGNVGGRGFGFDRVYWSIDGGTLFDTQFDIYEDIGKQMLDHAFSGFNTCILAYGQTGSGKTYTMMGDQKSTEEQAQGIIPRACCELFTKIDCNYTLVDLPAETDPKQAAITSYEVGCSYYEIYNEKVYDLLDPSKSKDDLRVREHPTQGPYVEGLTTNTVGLYDDVQSLLLMGNRHRHTNQTKLNDSSSRSHAIFTIILKQSMFREGELTEYVSRINLVDLAGSERTKNAGTSGDVLHEGININRSLCTLGQVIHNLAEACERHRDTFINFRDSNLTWLLRENLGGNSKTIMVATISPSSSCYDESLNTLRYADRVKQIRQRATVNEDSKTKLIRDLRHEVAQLRKEAMEFARVKHEVITLRKTAHGGLDPSDLQNELVGDSPYIIILKPNPAPTERAVQRLCLPVMFITDSKDKSTAKELHSRYASKVPSETKTSDVGVIKVPGIMKATAVFILPATSKSKSAFGNRLCRLIALEQQCDKVEIELRHSHIQVLGELAFRYADPTSVAGAEKDQFLVAYRASLASLNQETVLKTLTLQQKAQFESLSADQKQFFLSNSKLTLQERSELLNKLTNEGPVTERHVSAVFEVMGGVDRNVFDGLFNIQKQIFMMQQPTSVDLKSMTPADKKDYRQQQRQLLKTLRAQQQFLNSSQSVDTISHLTPDDQKKYNKLTSSQKQVLTAGQLAAYEIEQMTPSEKSDYYKQQRQLLHSLTSTEKEALAQLDDDECARYGNLTPEEKLLFLKSTSESSHNQPSKQLLRELSSNSLVSAKPSESEVEIVYKVMDAVQQEKYKKLTPSQKQYFMSQQLTPAVTDGMSVDEKKQIIHNQNRLLSALVPTYATTSLSQSEQRSVIEGLPEEEKLRFESLSSDQQNAFMSQQIPPTVAFKLSDNEKTHIAQQQSKLLAVLTATSGPPVLTKAQQQDVIEALPEEDKLTFEGLTPSQKELFLSQQLSQQEFDNLSTESKTEIVSQQRKLLQLCGQGSKGSLSTESKKTIIDTMSTEEKQQFRKLTSSQQEIFLSQQLNASDFQKLSPSARTSVSKEREELFDILTEQTSVLTKARRASLISQLTPEIKSQYDSLNELQQEFFASQQFSGSTHSDQQKLISTISSSRTSLTTQHTEYQNELILNALEDSVRIRVEDLPSNQRQLLLSNIDSNNIEDRDVTTECISLLKVFENGSSELVLTAEEVSVVQNLPAEALRKFHSLDNYQKRIFLSMQESAEETCTSEQDRLLSALVECSGDGNYLLQHADEDSDYNEMFSRLTAHQQQVFLSLTPRDKFQFSSLAPEHQSQITELTPRQRIQFLGLTPRQQRQFLNMTPRGDDSSSTHLSSEQLKILSEVTSSNDEVELFRNTTALPPLDMRSLNRTQSHSSPSSSIVTSVGPITTGGRRTTRYGEDIEDLKITHEGVLSQVIEEGKRDLRLMELQVTEAQKELEAKEKLLDEIQRENHAEREANERRLTEMEEQNRQVVEEAFREQARKSSQAEECISVLEIQFRDAEERHAATVEEIAAELSNTQAKLSATEAQLDEDRYEIGNAKVLQATTIQKLEEAYVTLRGMKAALADNTEQLKSLRGDLIAKTTCVDSLQQEIDRLHEIENHGKQRITELQRAHLEGELRIQENHDELRKLRQAEHEKSVALREHQRLSNEDLTKRERELRHLKELADKKEIAKCAVEAQCEQLKERVEGTQEELQRIQLEIRGCEDTLRQKEVEIEDLHGENNRLTEEHAKETDQQRKVREREMTSQQEQIRDLSEQISVIQHKARDIQQRNRDLYQNQERIRERRVRLENELEKKECELKETKGRYLETHQRLQTTIRRGKKEHEQLAQLRKLTSLVKEQEMRIEYLQKELRESQAHNKRLEETQAFNHTVDQVEAVKRDMNNVLSALKAEVIQFSPPALRQVQAIVNAVQHAVDPRRIFRQAFNHIRHVATVISGRNQKHGCQWDVQESCLGCLKTYQRASALKALREIVVWYGVSPDFARQEMTAYTELTQNAKFLILLAKFCQNPSMPDLLNTRYDVCVSDVALRPLILAARRSKSAGKKEKESKRDLESTFDTLPDPPPLFASTLPCTLITSPIPNTISSHRSRSLKGEGHLPIATMHATERSRSSEIIPHQQYSDERRSSGHSIQRHILNCSVKSQSRLRARSPGSQGNTLTTVAYSTDKLAEKLAASTVAYYSRGQSPHHFRIPITDEEIDDGCKKKGEHDPKKKNFMQGTVSSQGKEVHSRGFPLAVHMMRRSVRYTKPSRPY